MKKKIQLMKTTITNLSSDKMIKIQGGQETLAGPRCVTVDHCYPVVTKVTPCR